MRKLARELVIFMLLSAVASFVGTAGYLLYERHKANAPVTFDPFAGGVAPQQAQPQPLPELDASKGIQLDPAGGALPQLDVTKGIALPAPPAGYVDPCAVVSQTPADATTNGEIFSGSSIVSGCGFLAGILLWAFYRLVRFAVQG